MYPTMTPTRLTPTQIAAETYVVHHHSGEGTAPVSIALNAMVIRGAEPVIVDTGVPDSPTFFDDVFSIVEPEDVRWIFISHDDVDHTGNLNALAAACPNATVVINWFIAERMGTGLQVPPTRWRWIGDGEAFDAGDRTLITVRPPVYDSPTTRGLFDASTGVYWASDAFATPMLTPVRDVAELDLEFWQGGQSTFDNYLSPWLDIVDNDRYQATVDRVAVLRPTAIAGCHTPVITGTNVATAIDTVRRSPGANYAPQPDQAVLDQIQHALSVGA